MIKKLLILISLTIITLTMGCSVSDPLPEDLYTHSIYPSVNNTYNLGNFALTWRSMYVNDIYVSSNTSLHTLDGSTIGGIATEVDPIYTTDPAFGITAGNIINWNTAFGWGNPAGTYVPYAGATDNVNLGVYSIAPYGISEFRAYGDIITDRWLWQDSNTFLGSSVVGVGNLAHTGGAEGYYNSGFGYQSLNGITTGAANSAFGNASLASLEDGNYNAASGSGALFDLVSGDYNTAYGANAGHANLGSSNVFLGFKAGYNYLGDNALFIDNSDTATPLIGGNFSSHDVNLNRYVHSINGSYDMTQIAIEPASIADRAGIYAYDVSADNCTIGFNTEAAVEPALGVASTNRIPIRWNNITYYLLAEASGFYSPITGVAFPLPEDGLRIGTLFFDTVDNTWNKCTSLNPVTWEAISGGGGHTHSNMNILDTIQESFTTTLKASYDWLVSNITSTWKTIVDNHIANTNNPHSVIKSQVGLTNVTDDAQVAKSLVDAKGDIITATIDNTPARLASSGVNNQVLTVDTSTATGLKWTTPAGGGESEVVVVMSGDIANATVNLADATGMTFTADANSEYIVEGFILWNTSATTVGIKLSAAATNSPTIMAGHFITDSASGTPDSSSYNANNVVVTTSASAFTTYNSGKLNAIIKTGGSSSVWQLRFAAETTGTITLKQNSVLRYRKLS